MKYLFIMFLSLTAFGKNNHPVKNEINSISKETKKEIILKRILQLRPKAKQYKISLMSGDQYRPEEFGYTVELEELFELLPSKISEMETCKKLKSGYMLHFGITKWANRPEALADLWPVIKKICL